jgi:putative oxidoreductase
MQRIRREHGADWSATARHAVPWVLTGFLTLVFLSTGLPKLIGGTTYWSEAFAMWGYPTWFRIVVGVVETVGGICLLLPRTFTLGAIALAIVLFGATFTQLVSGVEGAGAPAALLALLLITAWGRARRHPTQSAQ